MTTLRQAEANRRNAQNSTGPTTQEGKERSRANALKHGAAGAGIVLPDAARERLNVRRERWRAEYVVATPEDEFVYDILVTASVQVEACQERIFSLREHLAARAASAWDDDRAAEAETLGAGLARRPARVHAALRRSKHGCLWLIQQWRGLLSAALSVNGWADAHFARAFDLLGTPLEFRFGSPVDHGQTPAQLAERQIALLRDRIADALDDIDASRRDLACQGRDPEPNAELNRLERYEAAAFRRFQWALARLERRPASSPQQPEASQMPSPPPVVASTVTPPRKLDPSERVPLPAKLMTLPPMFTLPTSQAPNRRARRAEERRSRRSSK